jgi:hypothetical protein
MNRCDWCLEEHRFLAPIENRNPTVSRDFEYVCPECAEVAYVERVGEMLLDGESSDFALLEVEHVSTTPLYGERIA